MPDIELRGMRISDQLSNNKKLNKLPTNCWYISYSQVPIQYLKENLNEQEISYEITYNTILKYDLSKKDFISCLLNYLKSNEVISNRKIFLKQYFHIKYLLLLSPESINDTLFSENKSYSVIYS